MKQILLIVLIALAFGCVSRKAMPSELVLFPKPGENKLWLINTISNDFHFCSLVSFETAGGKEYLTSFTSVWSKKDSAFYFGIKTTDKSTIAQITEFPLLLNLLKSDSSANEWNWSVARKKTVFNGELAREASKIKIKYKTQLPFTVSQIIEEPQVSVIAPVKSILKSSGKTTTQSSGTFCMSIFKNEKDLTKLAQKGSLIWMDLILDDGCLFNGLFKVNENTTTLLGYSLKDSAQLSNSTRRLTIEAKNYWKSTISNKSYPLTFTIQFPNNNKTINIQPILENQEVNAKKNSFWMGAIEALSSENKKIGSGNMYIFNK